MLCRINLNRATFLPDNHACTTRTSCTGVCTVQCYVASNSETVIKIQIKHVGS